MLWYLQRAGVNTCEAVFWCAERARQSALTALLSFPECGQLAACAPIADIKTAQAAARAAAAAAAEKAAAEAAAAAGVAGAWEEAKETELSSIADYVRANFKLP